MKFGDGIRRYSIRKLSIGVVSVCIGTVMSIYFISASNEAKGKVSNEVIPYTEKIVYDDNLYDEDVVIEKEGKNGERRITKRGNEIINDEVVTEPIEQIKRIGTKKTKQVETHEFTQVIPVKTEYRANSNLQYGEKNIIQDGKEGQLSVKESHTYIRGVLSEKQNIEEKVIESMEPRIIEVGTKQIITRVETPFDITYIDDYQLLEGVNTVVTEGEIGISNEITSFVVNPETGVVTKNVTIDVISSPKNKVIKRGTRVPELPVEIAYREIENRTIFIADDNLEFGNKIVVENGEKGSEKITSTYEIVDGRRVGEPQVNKEVVSQPKDCVIKVGTKTTEKVEHIEFTTKFIADDTRDINSPLEVTGGVNGTKITTTTYTLNTQTGEVIPNEVVRETNPVEKIVIVGTKPTEKTIELPYETKYVADETKAVGEPNEEVGGVNGSRTIVTTYDIDPNTGQLLPTENINEVLPVEKIVKVGAKPTEKTIELPYETKYVADETKAVGEPNEEVGGVNGSRTIVTTYAVDPSTGELLPTESVNEVLPTEKIVKVGAKATEEIVEVVPKSIEYRKNDNSELVAGTKTTIEEGRDGFITRITTYSVDERTGNVTSSVNDVITSAENQIVEVSTKPLVERVNDVEKGIRYEAVENSEQVAGTELERIEGTNGYTEKTTNYDINANDGSLIERASNRVVEKIDTVVKISTKPEVVEELIQYTTERIEVDNLAPGVEEIQIHGQPGKKVTTITYNLNENTGQTTANAPVVREEQPIKEVIHVGRQGAEKQKPTLVVTKLEPLVNEKSIKVTYQVTDTDNTFRPSTFEIYKGDVLVKTVNIDKQNTEVIIDDLEWNIDYVLKPVLNYNPGYADLTERIESKEFVLERTMIEIKQIEEIELWKNENGKLVRQLYLPENVSSVEQYFAKIKSSSQKEAILQVSDIALENNRYKVSVALDNLVEDREQNGKYTNDITFYVDKKPVAQNNVYTDFESLIAAINSNPFGNYVIGADMSASGYKLTDNANSYITNRFYGTLSGEHNGQNFAIYDLELPLFDKIEEGTIKNLDLKSVNINKPEGKKIGALAKEANKAKIENVAIEGNITANDYIGGFVADAYNTKFNDVYFKGNIYGLARQYDGGNSFVAGITAYLGRDSQIEKAKVDANMAFASSNMKMGGITAQMSPNARINKVYVTGVMTNIVTNQNEVGGLVGWIEGDTAPQNIISNAISTMKVRNGNKVYGYTGDNRQSIITNVYTLEGDEYGIKDKYTNEATKQEIESKLREYQLTATLDDSIRNIDLVNKVVNNYETISGFDAKRRQAYFNMEKLLPFYTKDIIVQQANRLKPNDSLVTKKLVDVVTMIGDEIVFDITNKKDNINKLMLHFDDKTIEYVTLSPSKEVNNGSIFEYEIKEKGVKFTPEVYISATQSEIINRLVSEFQSINYNSAEIRKVLGILDHDNDSLNKLMLEESFNEVKANIGKHLNDLFATSYLINSGSNQMEELKYKQISENKEKLLLGLAYMNRWYNIQYDDLNAKELMMKKFDFFGDNALAIDKLIQIGGLGKEMLKPKRNYVVASSIIALDAVDGDLFKYLDEYRQRFAKGKTTAGWFKNTTKATIIETNSTVPEALAKQLNPTSPYHYNTLFDKMKTSTWQFKEMALILLAMPSNDIFIMTDMANTLIGMYYNHNEKTIEEDLKRAAKEWAAHADYVYSILPAEHKEKMFRQIITWDTRRVPNLGNREYKLSDTHISAVKNFFAPLDYYYSTKSANAFSDQKDIYYVAADFTGFEGGRIYSHEMTHVIDDDTYLLGYGRRTGMGLETYAKGLFESNLWYEQDHISVNNIFDYTKYNSQSPGRRLTNLTPQRFKTTDDLKEYMKGYFDVLYTLDYLEAEAVLNHAPDYAKQNWFNQMKTEDDNQTTVTKYQNNVTTFEQLLEQGLVSRRSYDPAGSAYSFSETKDAYLRVNALNPIYGSLNNDGTSRNEFEFRKIAFELLAEYGYVEGLVPYTSNQYIELGDAKNGIADNVLISKITNGQFENSSEFRKAMFKRRQDKLNDLKPVTIRSKQDGNGYFYGETTTVRDVEHLRELMKQAVISDSATEMYNSQNKNNNYNVENSKVYCLKAAILNGYLQQTDDFRQSIYKNGN